MRICVIAGFFGAIVLCCLFLAASRRALSPVHAKDNAVQIKASTSARSGYVGDAACASCHRQQSIFYSHTAHALTSQLADGNSILGSFRSGSNLLMIATPETTNRSARLYFRMEKKNGGYYQTAVAERGTRRLAQSERIALLIGSGKWGQSYLYWHGDQLYELPVSYWTDGRQWINSPGYTDGTANFTRRVDPRCMECHATYIQALSPDPQMNRYDKASLILGISCETCHGPGARHVALEKASSGKPSSVAAHAILNPADFSRDRQVDLCALCHNGTQREGLLPAFSYRPGDRLDDYFAPNPLAVTEQADVHGNQVGLLKMSRCYRSSPSMTCSTCHNVHAPERTLADYSQRCLQCHTWQSCGVAKRMGIRSTRDCIDCHMPLERTNAIVSVTAGKTLHASIRSHWIKVYPSTRTPDGPAHR
ncbi:MAG: multiheme c-type cytochrome [Acidobacteriaceae bacterium]